MASMRSVCRQLISWPFFVGIGAGVALVAGAFAAPTYFVVQELDGRRADQTTRLVSPSVADREALPAYGTAPSDWTLRDVASGDTTTLGAVQEGTTVVVNVWATWCTPCRTEMPTLQALHDSTDRARVVLVLAEARSTVHPYLKKEDLSVPSYVVERFPTILQGQAIPRTYVLSPEGQAVHRHVGAADWNTAPVHRLLNRIRS